MPTYEYRCDYCGARKEVTAKISEYDSLQLGRCTAQLPMLNQGVEDQTYECGGPLLRVYTPVAGIVNGASARNNYGLKS